MPYFADVIERVVIDIKFFRIHTFTLAEYRKIKIELRGTELLLHGETRFATRLLSMRSVLDNRDSLRRLVVSPEWRAWEKSPATAPYRETLIEVKADFLSDDDDYFWRPIEELLALMDPVIKLLRVADSNEVGSICQIYPIACEVQAMIRDNTKLPGNVRDDVEGKNCMH